MRYEMQVNGKEMSVAAVAEWLAGLPEDYVFNDREFQQFPDFSAYGCNCLVGKYVNQGSDQILTVGASGFYPMVGLAVAPVPWDIQQLTHIFDYISEGEMTAAEVRKSLTAYLIFGTAEETK